MTTNITTLTNRASHNTLLVISMFYMSFMLCNAILTNRYIGSDVLFVLGGTLTSPFIFILDNIIAELYGFPIARNVILCGYAAQTLFILICQFIILLPYPQFFNYSEGYSQVLGISLLRINISGFVAYITANLINSYILTRWKVLVKGKYFWLRSLGCTSFSAALYSFIAILMMELYSLPMKYILHVATISFFIKITYSMILAFPAQILVNYLKEYTGMDVYDLPDELTPFKFLHTKPREQEHD